MRSERNLFVKGTRSLWEARQQSRKWNSKGARKIVEIFKHSIILFDMNTLKRYERHTVGSRN